MSDSATMLKAFLELHAPLKDYGKMRLIQDAWKARDDEIEALRQELAATTKERDLLLGTEVLSAGSGIPRTGLQSAWETFKPTATDNFTSFVAGWLAHSHFGPARLGTRCVRKAVLSGREK